MQRSFVSGAVRVGLALLGVLALPNALILASDNYLITPSGQMISGIFEGLRPSAIMLKFSRHSRRAQSGGWLLREDKIDWHAGAHYIPAQCGICPPETVCADHYQVIHESSGCSDTVACPLPLNNAATDTTTGSYDEGARDTFCGQVCCVDSYICPNP